MACHLPLVLLGLAHLVAGASTDSNCPATDGTSRSVWSILGSCALTLLICVWHALHPDVPEIGEKWFDSMLKRIGFVIMSFFAPEVVVARAGEEWCKAHCNVKEFRDKGYEWSTAHSYFAQMDGFVYLDEKGRSDTIDSDKFLRLCKEGKIANPLVTERQIRALGKSDAIGKAIFTIQLFWFVLQVIVRGSKGLAITLVELDTVCMAVLGVVYLLFWWDKPLRPDSPYVFCYTGEKKVYTAKELSNAWKPKHVFWDTLISRLMCIRKTQANADQEKVPADATDKAEISKPGKLKAVIEDLDSDAVQVLSLVITWLILGALHLIAWNFEFPTEIERMIWRIASIILAGSSPALVVVAIIGSVFEDSDWEWMNNIAIFFAVIVCISGLVSRALLVGLMLASLRALPCSAHDTVTWTAYIPHL